MLKIDFEEFIFEVKEEILSYEELGEEKAEAWERNFLKWLDKNKKGEKVYCCIEDESEIFNIVDEFYYANEQNSIDLYWEKFNIKLKFD